jgi:hypothetical protein
MVAVLSAKVDEFQAAIDHLKSAEVHLSKESETYLNEIQDQSREIDNLRICQRINWRRFSSDRNCQRTFRKQTENFSQCEDRQILRMVAALVPCF